MLMQSFGSIQSKPGPWLPSAGDSRPWGSPPPFHHGDVPSIQNNGTLQGEGCPHLESRKKPRIRSRWVKDQNVQHEHLQAPCTWGLPSNHSGAGNHRQLYNTKGREQIPLPPVPAATSAVDDQRYNNILTILESVAHREKGRSLIRAYEGLIRELWLIIRFSTTS